MSVDELDLDEATLARARRLAAERNVTLSEIFIEAIKQYSAEPSHLGPSKDIIGAFTDQAELLDEIVRDAYEDRNRPFRSSAG